MFLHGLFNFEKKKSFSLFCIPPICNFFFFFFFWGGGGGVASKEIFYFVESRYAILRYFLLLVC